MKKVLMMIQEACPYCKKALKLMDELKEENSGYEQVDVEIVDENRNPLIAQDLNYWYVPTYFVDGEKLHEGVPTKEAIKKVYEAALEN
ncbi:thioredoxin family protein [Lachnospiraceae bacterium 54-53]